MDKQRLTDEQVIKALECCIKSANMGECLTLKCPLLGDYGCAISGDEEKLYEYALDLINRLKAGNEQWKEEANKYQNLWCEAVEDIQTAKSEAYKEFADMLTGIFGFDELTGTVIKCHIDNLLAELTPTTLNKLPHNSLCETETYEG